MRGRALLACAALSVVSCTGGGDETAETTTSAAVPRPAHEETVEALAADAMAGRDNETPGSALAQEHIVGELSAFAEPLVDDFRHEFDAGTNIIGVLRGSALPEEYIVLGAHYDGLGSECRATPSDSICNGASDNAAGVAAMLEIGRRLAQGEPPGRSVVFAFWDAEEDGLLGSTAYVADPPVPLEATRVYLNWDIQGSNLLPSLTDLTLMVGAETGGAELFDAAATAAGASSLDTVQLSLLFGQGRSDHAVFAAAGVPTVFFTDATSACYHTASDDLSTVDLDKLAAQIETGEALTRALTDAGTAPSFVAGTPPASYEDARSMLAIMRTAEPDFERLLGDGPSVAAEYLADLEVLVEAGPEAFDDEARAVVISGAAAIVRLLTEGECDGFVGSPGGSG